MLQYFYNKIKYISFYQLLFVIILLLFNKKMVISAVYVDCDCPPKAIININDDNNTNIIIYDVNAIAPTDDITNNTIDIIGWTSSDGTVFDAEHSNPITTMLNENKKVTCNIKNLTDLNPTFHLPSNCIDSQIKILLIGFSNLTIMPMNLFQNYENLNTLTIYSGLINITKNNFLNAKNLIKLDLGVANNIIELESNIFEEMLNLEILDLSYNQIVNINETIFTKNLFKLNLLYLEANSIEILQNNTFNNLENLQILDLSRNAISEIEDYAFRNLFNLKKLYLYRNEIRILQTTIFSDLISLERIDLSINQIETIEENVFENLINLVSLELAFNQLTTFVSGQFLGAINLQNLYLSWNRLQFFNPNDMVDNDDDDDDDNNDNDADIIDVFNGIENLLILDLSFNALQMLNGRIFENLTMLETLELRDTGLNTLLNGTLFSNMYNLKVLDLSFNPLETVDLHIFATLRNLETLKLQSTGLTNLDVNGIHEILPSLYFMDLSDNNWGALECDDVTDMVNYLRNATIEYELDFNLNQLCELIPFDSEYLQFFKLTPQVNVLNYS